MTSKVQKKAFNNNYNHHRIFNNGEDLEEVEQEELQNKLNVLEIANPQKQNSQRIEQKKVNPTYKSQIFSSDYDEIPQFRNLNGQQFIKDQTPEQLFGIHGDMQVHKKRGDQTQPESASINQKEVPSQAQQQTKSEKPMPFNAMWWSNSSKPNNDPNAYQADFARQRKNKDYSSNNIFQTEQSQGVETMIQQYNQQNNIRSNTNQLQNNSNVHQKYNIISNVNEDKSCQETSNEQLAQQKNILQQQIQGDIDVRKVNRNYSNLFGRCQTPLISGESHPNNALSQNNQSHMINNKSELFLPSNANIDTFDSRKYNPKIEKENTDMNACQRHFKNLQSVLDTHTHQAEFKRGVLINKEMPAQYDAANNLLDGLSENRSQILSENKPLKKVFVRAGEMEKIQQIEFKSMKTHFDQENFKRFCVQKGYKVLVFTSNSNGRGSIFLRENRKNPDPIDSVTAHLKIHGTNVAQLKEITGKEFNLKLFEAPVASKKSGQPPRPATGKKQFSNQQPNAQSHNIFNEEKKNKI